MTSEEPLDDRCAAKCRDGGFCVNHPVQGSERCRMHGGTVGENHGNPNAETAAITHGVKTDPFRLYDHLEDEHLEWVDSLIEGYCDLLDYGEGDPRRENVKRACISIYQANSGEGQILEDGLSESQTIGVSDEGQPIVRNEGHHLNDDVLARDREARQLLRTMGAFDDPESQKAEALANQTITIEHTRVTEDTVDEFSE